MLKKLFIIPLLAIAVSLPFIANAREQSFISVFVRDDCQHCQAEEQFLTSLKRENPDIILMYYNLKDEKSRILFDTFTTTNKLSKVTPITLVHNTIIQGFSTAETTGQLILTTLNQQGDNTTVEQFLAKYPQGKQATNGGGTCDAEGCSTAGISWDIHIPIINKTVDLRRYSLPVISFLLGLVDGFNPCAMWVLIMFVLMLSQAGSKKRMLEYAGLFLIAETLMYYLILTVWFTAWDFIALDRVVTPVIGGLALGAGSYFLYKFKNHQDECAVAGGDSRKKIMQKIRDITTKPLTLAVAIGIIGLALSVNIFEFACSIGIPQTFTKILDINNLSFWPRNGMMGIYILGYMLDDLFVFSAAIIGLEKTGLAKKYSRWSLLIGGVLMVILGLIMLIKPALLISGL